MLRNSVFFVFVFSFSLFAAQKAESKVDSMIYETGMEWKTFPSASPVKAFSVQKDLLWFASEKGVTWLSMSSTKKNDQQTMSDVAGVPASDVTSIATDGTASVFVGTKAGCAIRSKTAFSLITKDNGLSDNKVNKIVVERPGKVWVATDNGVSLYQNGTWKIMTSKDGLAGDIVHDMASNGKGVMWFGTNKGISSFDGSSWTSYTMKTGLSWNDTKAITIDPKTGVVWAAVGEKDINCYDGKAWKVFMDVADGIVNIMADTQSRIWIATASGLMKFNGDEWVTDPQKIGITATQVTQMYRDEKGNLWFGMENGVIKLANPYPY